MKYALLPEFIMMLMSDGLRLTKKISRKGNSLLQKKFSTLLCVAIVKRRTELMPYKGGSFLFFHWKRRNEQINDCNDA
jgi:hypothetical protein